MINIDISPVAFTIGGIAVRWYGVMIAIGVIIVVAWLIRAARRGAKISQDTILSAAVVGIPSGVIISRLLHVIDNWSFFMQNPGMIIGFEGLTIWGAILGAALGIWIFSRFSHFNFGYLADLLVPALIIAQAIGRMGCPVNGCCYGNPTTLPWGITYTNPESYGPLGIAVQPTQVYEILFLLALLGPALKLRGKFQPDGVLFLMYLGAYSVWRIGVDFIREGTPFLFGLHQAQVIGIVVLLIVVPYLILKLHRAKPELAGGGEVQETKP